MGKESWFSSLWRNSWKKNPIEKEKIVIGMLTFEVGSLMSKVVHLWNCLKDEQVIRMREEMMNSAGVRKLVSDDDEYLIGLVCAEMVENLSFVVRSVARIGRKCSEPALQRLENVFDDLVSVRDCGWEFSGRKMDNKVREMEKLMASSGNLYHELEVLNEVEQVLRRLQGGSSDQNLANRVEIQKKVAWQRMEVKHLREVSLWNKSYDYVVRLLARSIFTIVRRIKDVFGIHQNVQHSRDFSSPSVDYLPRSRSISALTQSSVHPSENSLPRFASGPLGRSTAKSGPIGGPGAKSGPIHGLGRLISKSGPLNGHNRGQSHDQSANLNGKPPRSKNKRLVPAGPFKGCIMGGNKSPVMQNYSPAINGYPNSYGIHSGVLRRTEDAYEEPQVYNNILLDNLLRLSSKCKLLVGPPSTLGGSALALHYANVIIVIEKLVESPHLIGPDARDDLYSMLPKNVKAALRSRLKSFVKTASSFYDTDLATEWNEALSRILEWLAPLAHNMIRWQSERNFQQQHLVSRTTVLLVQTLFFANQAKTEAAITELLVGLNYLWRFGRELNAKALMECASSGEFDNDDYLDYKE